LNSHDQFPSGRDHIGFRIWWGINNPLPLIPHGKPSFDGLYNSPGCDNVQPRSSQEHSYKSRDIGHDWVHFQSKEVEDVSKYVRKALIDIRPELMHFFVIPSTPKKCPREAKYCTIYIDCQVIYRLGFYHHVHHDREINGSKYHCSDAKEDCNTLMDTSMGWVIQESNG